METDRDVLFANEAFVIGMLQAVSGAALVAALAQADVLLSIAGHNAFLVFLTIIALSLLFAVLAAYWKHQYKLWDVKAQASLARNDSIEAQKRSTKANRYLKAMRAVVVLSLSGILLGIVELIVSIWWTTPIRMDEQHNVAQLVRILQVLSSLSILAGTWLLAFGLKVRPGITSELEDQLKLEEKGLIATSSVRQRPFLFWLGLALITLGVLTDLLVLNCT